MTHASATFSSRPDWQNDASCRHHDPELWWDEDPHSPAYKFALGMCQTICTVREDCLRAALAMPELFGIWGGYTAKQRAQLRREAKAVA